VSRGSGPGGHAKGARTTRIDIDALDSSGDIRTIAEGAAAVRSPRSNATTAGELLRDERTCISTAAAIEPVGTAAYAGAEPCLPNLAVTPAALSSTRSRPTTPRAPRSSSARRASAPTARCRTSSTPFSFRRTAQTVTPSRLRGVVRGR